MSTHEGEAAMLRALLRTGLTLRLFANEARISRTSTGKSFIETSFPGYEPPLLALGDWKLVPGHGPTATRAESKAFTFTRTQGGVSADVYGWYLTDPDGVVVESGKFESTGKAWDLRRAEDAIKVVAVLKFPDGDVS